MVKTTYKEFKILIEEDGSRIRLFRPSGLSSKATIPMSQDVLTKRTIALFSRWLAEGKILTLEELEVLGTHLYKGLFDVTTRQAFLQEWKKVRDQPSTTLCLVLEFEYAVPSTGAGELAEMPWEYLYCPDDGDGFFLATRSRLILARHIPPKEEVRELEPEERALHILIVVSSPEKDMSGKPLDKIDASRVIQTINDLAKHSPRSIKTKELCQPTKRRLIEEVANFQPHVLHFIGPGRAGGLMALVSEEDETEACWINGEDLADCFEDQPPYLLFLHACDETPHSTMYEAFRGVALRLVYSGITAVVAIQYKVDHEVANRFVRVFYRSLGEGKPIDAAVQDGRQELKRYIEDGENFSSRAFGSLIVYMQSTAKGVIIVEAQPELKEPRLQPGPELTPHQAPRMILCPYGCGAFLDLECQFCTKCHKSVRPCPKNCGRLVGTDNFCGLDGPIGDSLQPDLAADISQSSPVNSPTAQVAQDSSQVGLANNRTQQQVRTISGRLRMP